MKKPATMLDSSWEQIMLNALIDCEQEKSLKKKDCEQEKGGIIKLRRGIQDLVGQHEFSLQYK